ncbi:MAG: phosphotransferase [Acetobacteraceae bacterium]|nr:phosphotransferase [Acetobacteraceae bacterium]
MNALSPIFATMTVPADDVSAEEAAAVALGHWGIAATAKLLTGERDRNFHLTAADGREYVLKFANPAEPVEVTDLQVKALQHVARTDPQFNIPRMIPLPDGRIEATVPRAPRPARVRLLSWVHGTPLRHAPRSAAQREACGRALARLGLALQGFSHPHARYELIWDLTHALRLREILANLEDAPAEAAIGALLDDFAREAAPVLPGLRQQVLYNDMNHGNTLVDPARPDEVAGIIDFGDIVHTAVAIDVAVGAITAVGPDMAIADALARFVGGFHAVRPLLAEEVALLPLLVAVRAAIGTVLQAWHRQVHADNPHYAPMTAEELQRRLDRIAALRAPAVGAALRGATGLG